MIRENISVILVILFVLNSASVFCHELSETDVPELNLSPGKKLMRTFIGAETGFTFGDYIEVRLSPFIGYRFSPKITGGVNLFTYIHGIKSIKIHQTKLPFKAMMLAEISFFSIIR